MSSISKNNETNKNSMLTLNELNKRKVVEHNDLISSVAKMDKTPLKIFELAVSCIDTDNPPKDNTIFLSKKELFTFFKVSDNDKHSRFKEAIEKMQKQAFFQIKEVKNEGYEMISIVPIPTVKWNNYNDEVMIRFNQDIMPYLIDLKQNFTQYAISDIMELNSKYSIILYKWLCMFYNQYEHYTGKGGRRTEQVEGYRNPSITVKDLRMLTDTVDEYPRFDNFESWIIKKPLDEINSHTHFKVTYEKIKKGRSIDSIIFHITKRHMTKDNSYKIEDTTYKEAMSQREDREDKLAIEAIKSKYTKLLLEHFLLAPYDMTDIAIMAALQKNVYPKYDELKELRGIDGVKKHLSYVQDKQLPYSKGNIGKYLKKSIDQYLPIVKRQEI